MVVSTKGPKPGEGAELGEPSRTTVFYSAGRVAIERYNGDDLGSRYVRGDGPDWIYFVGPNSVARVDAILAVGIINQTVTSAHLLLEMANRSEYLRAAGQVTDGGKRYNVTSYADTLGRLQTIYFDAETNLLAKAQILQAHAQWGDTVTELVFEDYQSQHGARLSQMVSVHQAGALLAQFSIQGIDLTEVDENVFARPEDATENDPFSAPSNAPRELAIESLSDGVYFIENAAQGYNVIFIDQADGILVLETPQSPQTVRDVIRAIHKKFPNKTIKAAVPTHHHFDHSGGLYGFLEAGIPILTTPGNADFVRKIGSTDRVIGQSKGAVSKPQINTFTGQRKLGSGDVAVELINVGPNPHAEEIVIAYIPAIKAVFVADLFSARGEELPPANANQLAFADALEKLDLDIEMIIPVHGTRTPIASFWDSVKRGREATE